MYVNIFNFNFLNSRHRNQCIGLDFRILIKADLKRLWKIHESKVGLISIIYAYKWLTSKLYWSAVGNE